MHTAQHLQFPSGWVKLRRGHKSFQPKLPICAKKSATGCPEFHRLGFHRITRQLRKQLAGSKRNADWMTPPPNRQSNTSCKDVPYWARCRLKTTSSPSASSTRAVECSWSSTRLLADASTKPGDWRCANASAADLTLNCRPQPPTTA